MPKVRYVGPHDEVDIPALGVTVQRGKAVDAPARVANALLAQSDFQPVRPPAKKAAAKPSKNQQPVTADKEA